MSAEAVPKIEPTTPLSHEEQEVLLVIERNNTLEVVLDKVNNDVPSSAEDAFELAGSLVAVRDSMRAEGTDTTVNPDLWTEFDEKAGQGVANWQLSAQKRSAWALASGARTLRDVPAELKSNLPEELSDIQKLAKVQDEGARRLKLDEAIENALNAKTMDHKEPESVVQPAHESGLASDTKDAEQDLSDIVKFSKNGRAQREDGKFISNYQLEQIADHADLIREGLGKHERAIGLIALDSRGLAHRPNGQIMSKQEVADLNAAGRKEWLAKQPKKVPVEAAMNTPVSDEKLDKLVAKYESLQKQKETASRLSKGRIEGQLATIGAAIEYRQLKNSQREDTKPQTEGLITRAKKLREAAFTAAAHPQETIRQMSTRNRVLGALAVSAAVGVGIYAATKGFDFSPEPAYSPQNPNDAASTADYFDGLRDMLTAHGTEGASAATNTAEAPSIADILQANATAAIESGHGPTQELVELVAKAQYDLSPVQSYDLYKHLEDVFGGKFFEENAMYQMGNGDYGIKAAGELTWRPEVIDAIADWLKKNA